MNIRKIVAREFLYLLSVFLFLAVVFIGVFSYNSFRKNKISKINEEFFILNGRYQNFLSEPLKEKNIEFRQETLDLLSEYINSNKTLTKKNAYETIPILNHDSILLQGLLDYASTMKAGKYKYRKEQNLKFPEFFIFSQSQIDSLKYYQDEIGLLESKKIKFTNTVFSNYNIKSLLYKIGFLLLILFFGIRYLYYSTKWSIKTIKN